MESSIYPWWKTSFVTAIACWLGLIRKWSFTYLMWSQIALERSPTSTLLGIFKPQGKHFPWFRACSSLNFPWVVVGGIKNKNMFSPVPLRPSRTLGGCKHVHKTTATAVCMPTRAWYSYAYVQ